MNFKKKLTKKKYLYYVAILVLIYFVSNSYKIYNYASVYSEDNCDVAIVLGAGTNEGKLSPVFCERINHSIYLYNKGAVEKIIITGGYGEGQKISDSEVGRNYAMTKGVLSTDVLGEKKSRYTIENLIESKLMMDSLGLKTALLVSDPLHMKRAINLAKNLDIDCKPSPTKTSMYRTKLPKLKSLIYETFYYSLGKII